MGTFMYFINPTFQCIKLWTTKAYSTYRYRRWQGGKVNNLCFYGHIVYIYAIYTFIFYWYMCKTWYDLLTRHKESTAKIKYYKYFKCWYWFEILIYCVKTAAALFRSCSYKFRLYNYVLFLDSIQPDRNNLNFWQSYAFE